VASPDELVRVVRLADGSLRTGRTLPGRGAWLCKGSAPCLTQAQQRDAFSRSLRVPVSALAVDQLSKEFAGVCEDRELHPSKTRRD